MVDIFQLHMVPVCVYFVEKQTFSLNKQFHYSNYEWTVVELSRDYTQPIYIYLTIFSVMGFMYAVTFLKQWWSVEVLNEVPLHLFVLGWIRVRTDKKKSISHKLFYFMNGGFPMFMFVSSLCL